MPAEPARRLVIESTAQLPATQRSGARWHRRQIPARPWRRLPPQQPEPKGGSRA